MARGSDDLFDDEPSDEELDEAFDAVRKAFHDHLEEFRQEHADMPYGILSALCAEMSVTARMLDYIDSVDKPSTAGLKLELDRLLRGFESTVRLAKKGADEFVSTSKQPLAEAEKERDSD
jgi:hypothetical protein